VNTVSARHVTAIYVVKSDGRKEVFNPETIKRDLWIACGSVCSAKDVDAVVNEVLRELENREYITTAEIVDRVERILLMRALSDPKFFEVAKKFELLNIYRDVYGEKWNGEWDPVDLRLSFDAVKVLASRYLLRDPDTRKFKETPRMMFERVAKAIAEVEYLYCRNRLEPIDKCKKTSEYWFEKFFELMSSLRFLPNSPTLMNAGTKLGILSACFVIPVRDSITTPNGEGIYDAVRAQAVVFQQGGGTGFDFSELRPEGDAVASTGGVASGPLSFMKMFDANTDVIKQGGRRRGANMGVLHVWHADVEKFVDAKSGKLKDVNLQNFNISVGVYDYFMEAVLKGEDVPLINPRKTNIRPDLGNDSRFYAIARARHYMSEEWIHEVIADELEKKNGSAWLDESAIITVDEALKIAEEQGAIVGIINAAKLFEKIVRNAWDSGDPGLLFIDTINRRHPVWYLGKINATNPCGEQPLLPWESCNLGSINLEKYVDYDENGRPRIAWQRLAEDIKIAVRFMDDVIDAAKWPLPQLESAVKRTRKIGLGVMGWHHMLIKLGIPYDSVDALYLAYYLAEWIEYNAALASIELAKERGSFPAYDPEKYRPTWLTARPLKELLTLAGIEVRPSKHVLELIDERPTVDWGIVEMLRREYGIRNAALTSIAPTGTISIIAGTSSSIEPIFAVAYERHVTVGRFIEVDKLFLEYLSRYELDTPEFIEEVVKRGSIADVPYAPKTLRKLFKGAHDIEPLWHVLHQAVWQQWVCAGVSKTVNLRYEATIEDVREVYLLAWRLGCKGITVYRDKSKARQVIYVGVKATQELREQQKTASSNTSDLDKAVSGTTSSAPPTKLRLEGQIDSLIEAITDQVSNCPTCEV